MSSFQRMPSPLQLFCLGLEARCNSAAEVPSPPRLGYPVFFPRSFQYGSAVTGVIDAFVYAHRQVQRNIENPGNYGDCMKGRIHFMTAITSACAHAYQLICLTRHILAVQSQKFRLPVAKARYPHLPNARTTTRDTGKDFQGWAIDTDGGTRLADGEISAGWSAIARSHHGSIDICQMVCIRTISPRKDFCHVLSGCHDRSTSRVRRSQNPFH